MLSFNNILHYPKYWAECYGVSDFLPRSKDEMDQLGWDSCDVVLVTGDAYIDHPSFGMAIIGRYLESLGYRVGIIDQPDWNSKTDFMRLGKPNLFYGVTSGNMDSMINRYTADKKIRSDDSYSPDGAPNKRPDRSVIVYSQRCREAYKDVPIIIGGIEASLRRVAHYDYWSDKVRRSILVDSKADILVYGNGERPLAEIAYKLANGTIASEITSVPGTVVSLSAIPEGVVLDDQTEIPSKLKKSNKVESKSESVILVPSYEEVSTDSTLYAHASYHFNQNLNPYSAHPLMQIHDKRVVWQNPPPMPLSTEEIDYVYDLPFKRIPHPDYAKNKMPAYEMIRFSVNIMRGCFGGCSFCSIGAHEGKFIQSRSEESVLEEISKIESSAPGFTGIISDVGGPSANMYKMKGKNFEACKKCKRPSCLYPEICSNLDDNHKPLIELYQKSRQLPGIKKILIGSGIRHDLALRSKPYIRELVQHHVGGYLKIAPEHTQKPVLRMMYKPGVDVFERFIQLFMQYSKEAGKEQYIIPYFIAGHPGTSDQDMLDLAIWLKRNKFRVDQVQNFYPTPLTKAAAMYHTDLDVTNRVTRESDTIKNVKKGRQRHLQKAFLRYHDPKNWDLLRKTLYEMGKNNLVGNDKRCLIPKPKR